MFLLLKENAGTMLMNRILVLMSTYNGEKYLKNQLNTIYEQKNVDVMLFVRDDSSKDSTLQILEEYRKVYGKMIIFKRENIGSARSFYKLVEEAALTDYDYFAFSDQDDIWHPKKLEYAIQKLKERKI